MEHADHVALIRGGVIPGIWADLGSGAGAFTLALADLLGPGCRIVSVDRDGRALRRQREAVARAFPQADVTYLEADFTRRLDLPPLDGALMANSLHFERRKEPALELVARYLRPGGRLLLVEYDSDRGNRWVPYPLSFAAWQQLAAAQGFVGTRLLSRRESRWQDAMYAAVSLRD